MNDGDGAATTAAELSIVGALLPRDVSGFWPIWASIFVWMALSNIAIHLMAFAVAALSLRHHQWWLFLSSPFLVMCIITPVTQSLTSSFIALALTMANKPISTWHCIGIGLCHTLIIVFTSFSRLLATL